MFLEKKKREKTKQIETHLSPYVWYTFPTRYCRRVYVRERYIARGLPVPHKARLYKISPCHTYAYMTRTRRWIAFVYG